MGSRSLLIEGLVIANFLLAFIIAMLLGGDALNGKVEHGAYYLGSHGRFTEVSLPTYIYSIVHTSIAFLTLPLGMIAAFILWFRYGRNTRVGS